MADPSSRLRRHSRPSTKPPSIAEVVARARRGGPVARDHRRRRRVDRRHGGARRRAGATVVRHPYNKGNGAAVKSGIRRATGEYVLISTATASTGPEDARRLVVAARRVRPRHRRALDRRRRRRMRGGSATRALNWLASYLTGREIPDLTSGFRGARRAQPARVPAPAAERLLDADDDDAGVHQGGLQRRVRADRGAPARRAVEDPARARRREVLHDHPEDRHALQPAAGLPADQRWPSFALGAGVRASGRSRRSATSPTRRSCSSCFGGHRVPRRPGLGADLGAALRRPAVVAAR